jgi:two-component system chemotaxis sensor kinase CheA
METSEYLPMFLAEGREHTQELNLAVVRIEERPDDRETVDEIFRIAHSLKGMSATMGFAGMAALTHKMEDVFELLRQRAGGLSRDAIDVLLACLDALEACIEDIETTGAETIVPEPLITRLDALVRERAPEQEKDRHGAALAPADLPSRAAGRRVVRVTVQLSDSTLMPSVRSYMAITAVGDHGEILSSAPEIEAVEGFDGRQVVIWLASDHEEGPIAATAREVPDVVDARAQEVDPAGEVELADHAVLVPVPVPIPVAGAAAPEPVQEEPADGEPEAPATAAAPKEAGGQHARKHGSTVRVDAERLDQLMHFIGELVLHRTQVEALASQADVPGLSQAMQNLTRTSHALQAMVMQVRMIPVEAVFLRFPRLVRDLSTKLGKQVELELVGQDTEMDRTVVELLGDPLVHLVRNSLDHGLEPAQEREAAGKPATGRLQISAHHAGGNVIITVHDDGRGIDVKRVARKAAEKGLISADQVDAIDMARAAELLFLPGFSTHDVATDLSGRGVGMDAVRTAIRELGGEVILTSEPGHGTTAQIRLPLTLAIINALLVEADGKPLAIPIDRVERTIRLSDHTVRSVAGNRMLVMRDGVLPILDANERFGRSAAVPADHAVVVRGSERRLALGVTRLIGQRELVTRPLPADIVERSALSGGAVLSDGAIALIVDCDALFESAAPSALPVAA